MWKDKEEEENIDANEGAYMKWMEDGKVQSSSQEWIELEEHLKSLTKSTDMVRCKTEPRETPQLTEKVVKVVQWPKGDLERFERKLEMSEQIKEGNQLGEQQLMSYSVRCLRFVNQYSICLSTVHKDWRS